MTHKDKISLKAISISFLLVCLSLPIQAKDTVLGGDVTELNADGPNQGLSAYDLIRQFGGPKPIESPDLYPGNHTGVKHILEHTDNIVGHHFVFLIHKNEDRDRDKFTKFGDRQRNEITAEDSLEAFLFHHGNAKNNIQQNCHQGECR